MLTLAKRFKNSPSCYQAAFNQIRWVRPVPAPAKAQVSGPGYEESEEKSEWWIIDCKIHEIGDHVPPRENKRRKQLREQFMRRTRLVLKETGAVNQIRWVRTESGPSRRRQRHKSPALAMRKSEEKSEWWIVDGEIHEIGDHVPPRERFVIPRDNIPNKRRKQLREQFMRRTRLVLKETEHEPWCKRYMELYQELRENWERLYWDEGYSKKIAMDHANYDSAEDDDHDFSPYRSKRSHSEPFKDNGFGNRQGDTWEKVNQIRDKFEYDRERRMREKAFAPMSGERASSNFHDMNSRRQPFDTHRYFPDNERE